MKKVPKLICWEVVDETGRVVSSYEAGLELLALRLMNELQRKSHRKFTVNPVWSEVENE